MAFLTQVSASDECIDYLKFNKSSFMTKCRKMFQNSRDKWGAGGENWDLLKSRKSLENPQWESKQKGSK